MFRSIIILAFLAIGARCVENPSELSNDELKELVKNAASDRPCNLPSPTEPIDFAPKGRSYRIFKGKLTLSGGVVWGMSDFKLNGEIKRNRDVITFPIFFKNVTYDYEYDMNLKILNNDGNVWGYILNLGLNVPVRIENNEFVLDQVPEFKDTTTKKVVYRNGGILEDMILNHISETIHSIVHDMVKKVYVEVYANNFVKQLNEAFKSYNNTSTN